VGGYYRNRTASGRRVDVISGGDDGVVVRMDDLPIMRGSARLMRTSHRS